MSNRANWATAGFWRSRFAFDAQEAVRPGCGARPGLWRQLLRHVSFRFWQFGEWKDVEIDDRLPTKYGKLCFMRSEDRNEFWSALLEKAYAKLNGSYEALSGGNQAEAMVDFTGGLCETFDMRRAPPNLYNIMVQANNACSLMGCAIESEQLEGHLSNGLITGHAYSVTDVKKVRLNNGMEESLVRVRNPWGNECEWKGDWSDHSHKWSSVSQGEKDKLGMDQRDDGEFWMSYKDFSSQFQQDRDLPFGPGVHVQQRQGRGSQEAPMGDVPGVRPVEAQRQRRRLSQQHRQLPHERTVSH
ncbi:hypothetical protein BOX15_Mlig013791g2 [Macrostomum lignano]|uniref:Calpain catalytic domain-containing protein n=1 Tax=Macrostomum lignano TaxID=282301 RepID=A0A267DX18_9PLAT|nr:hypothetical protein BOX15_Mlig013791g2 [Macrostomum lignano]